MIARLICLFKGHDPRKLENRWVWASLRPRVLLSMRFCGRCGVDMPIDFAASQDHCGFPVILPSDPAYLASINDHNSPTY